MMMRGMAANEPLGELEWNFSQVFGERTPGEEVQDGEGVGPHKPMSCHASPWNTAVFAIFCTCDLCEPFSLSPHLCATGDRTPTFTTP